MTPLCRRPAIGLMIGCVAGTWLGLGGHPYPRALLAAAAGFAAAAAAAAGGAGRGRAPPESLRRIGLLCLHASVCTAAWLGAALQAGRGAGPPPFGMEGAGAAAEIAGVVAGEAEDASRPGGAPQRVFPVLVETVQAAGTPPVSWPGQVEVRWRGGGPNTRRPAYGERWRFEGRLRAVPRRGAGPPLYVFGTGPQSARFLSAGHGSAFLAWCLDARQRAARSLERGIEHHAQTADLIQAILLGYRSQLIGRTREVFMRTGTLHVFAISGQHVAIFCGLVAFALCVLRIPRTWWFVYLAPVITAYTVATGARASALRAWVMAMLIALAPSLGRKPDVATSLAAAAVAILAVAPAQLRDAGFVCSFVVVTGLLVLTRPLMALAGSWAQADPWQLQAEPAPVALARRVLRSGVAMVAVSAAGWVASTPLTAYFFGQFTPIGLVSNLFVVPGAFFVVLGGCLSVVLEPWFGWAAEVFNHANLVLMSGTVWGLDLLARLPGSSVRVAQPPAWLVALAYAAAAACTIPYYRRRAARR